MESRSILRPNRGFTLIEILVVIGIFAIIFSFSLFVSFDFYRSYALRTEKNAIISILQKARSQSLNNIDQAKHGVHFSANPLQYVIFEGNAYNPIDTNNVIVNPSYGVSVAGTPFDVQFEQLSGASADKTITVSDGIKSYDVTINSEGRISW